MVTTPTGTGKAFAILNIFSLVEIIHSNYIGPLNGLSVEMGGLLSCIMAFDWLVTIMALGNTVTVLPGYAKTDTITLS